MNHNLAAKFQFLGIFLACVLSLPVQAAAQGGPSVSPSSIDFGSQSVKLESHANSIYITNTAQTSITITSFSVSPSQFHLYFGAAPITMAPGEKAAFGVSFAPDSAQSFSGAFTLNFQNYPSVTVSLLGTGINTSAIAAVSPASVDFGFQHAGTTSAGQKVTVSNMGTSALTVGEVDVTSPVFTITGFSGPTVLNPGDSLSVLVNFTPDQVANYPGTLKFVYDVLPPSGSTLTGVGTSPTAPTMTSASTLPGGTQGYPYLAVLQAAGGTPPYQWRVKPGSVLPQGLSLSSSGTISGSIAGTVAVGNYTFTVQAKDSGSPTRHFSKDLTVPVALPTGANCSEIVFNDPTTLTPLIPLNDLGLNLYQGQSGGLYDNGSNNDPTDHMLAGYTLAKSIQPLDINGNPDPNGKYVLLSLGISSLQQPFTLLQGFATADPSINPHLVVVNGAQGGFTAKKMLDTGGPDFWGNIANYYLPQSGVSAYQVEAVLIQTIDTYPTQDFSTDVGNLQSEYTSILQLLHTKFPNLKLVYLLAPIYQGYSEGVTPFAPPPYDYNSAYAVRGVIEDQINGDPNLNYDPANGTVMAPWVEWGPYLWANGMQPRSDGLAWSCQDISADGIHPAGAGKTKVVDMILNFLKTDGTTKPWFLAP